MGVVREVVAYHEAGHAVVALDLGVGLRREGLSIVAEGDTAGWAATRKGFRGSLDGLVSDATRLRIEHRVMVSQAGIEAQRLFRPRSVRLSHGGGDVEQIVPLLLKIDCATSVVEAHAEYLRLRVETMLWQPLRWARVSAVAEALALAAHNKLSPAEVKDIAREAEVGIGWREALIRAEVHLSTRRASKPRI